MRLALILLAAAFASPALAETPTFTLTLKNHAFEPATLEVPAGQKITLIVKNEDTTPAEFESHDLKREKIIKGNSEAKINLGPLGPGSYGFFDEFNEATTKGTLIAK